MILTFVHFLSICNCKFLKIASYLITFLRRGSSYKNIGTVIHYIEKLHQVFHSPFKLNGARGMDSTSENGYYIEKKLKITIERSALEASELQATGLETKVVVNNNSIS